jgi:hypothetical protein
LTEPLLDAGREMLRQRIRLEGRGLRLLGLGVSGLESAGQGQGQLFSSPEEERARRISLAADAVRDRIGEKSVTRARLIKRPCDDRKSDDPEEASSLPAVD